MKQFREFIVADANLLGFVSSARGSQGSRKKRGNPGLIYVSPSGIFQRLGVSTQIFELITTCAISNSITPCAISNSITVGAIEFDSMGMLVAKLTLISSPARLLLLFEANIARLDVRGCGGTGRRAGLKNP